MPSQEVGQVLERIEGLLGKQESRAAENAARALLLAKPGDYDGLVLLGHALRMQGRATDALASARHAQSLIPHQPAARMLMFDLLIEQSARVEALALLQGLAAEGDAHPPRLLQDVAERYTMLGLHAEAEQCHAHALARERNNPQFIYNHSTSLIALGRLAQAEAALDRVIDLKPDDADAWYNRATLRKQTPDYNHVAAIEAQLAKTSAQSSSRVALGYALAKELEDLREYPRSFAALKQAADLRRNHLRYRVEDDIETMQLIASAFDEAFFARKHPGHEDARPMFIVGLPRSGTTLVDRILSSHSAMRSRGETSDFVMALVKQAGKVGNKAELVQRSTRLDFAELGRAYCANLSDSPAERQIDKTPVNFLYLGLIAAALPSARIIHLRRNPMDVCYAMYKTLFRMAYPYSYDLGDLAHYWIAYDALMKHWKRVLPASQFLEINYEDLVADQEGISRQLIGFVGLPWQQECLAFERNPEPSLTASAAQVRQPIYTSSVALWRRYETELAPLRAVLEAAGVVIEPTDSRAAP
ncbi:MAG: sulfotransferase [Dokdonella sp.]